MKALKITIMVMVWIIFTAVATLLTKAPSPDLTPYVEAHEAASRL